MRSNRAGALLATVAALLLGLPARAAAHGQDVLWVELCDALHPGRRVPLPLPRDHDAPPAGCHAACALMPDRRARR